MRIGKIFVSISILAIVVAIILLSKSVYDSYKIETNNYDAIYNYVNNIDKSIFNGVLEIPAINLKTGIVSDVDKGLIFVNDKLIAGHSGNCKACYFDNLDKLEIGDNVFLYLDYELQYKVDSIKEVDKNHVYINGDLNLITCKKDDKNRRLLISLRKI